MNTSDPLLTSIQMISVTGFYIIFFVYMFWFFPKSISKALGDDVQLQRKRSAYETFRKSGSLKVLFALSIIFFVYGGYNLVRLYLKLL